MLTFRIFCVYRRSTLYVCKYILHHISALCTHFLSLSLFLLSHSLSRINKIYTAFLRFTNALQTQIAINVATVLGSEIFKYKRNRTVY